MRMRVRLRWLVASLVLIAQLGLFVLGVQAAPPATDPVVHVVRWGETVFSIARRYGTTINAIVSTNNLRNPNYVYAGQRLVIPTSSLPSSTGSTTIYVVRRGDRLSTIAARYGTTVSYLANLNGLRNPNFIWVGQTLKVPSSSATAASENQGSPIVHVVRRGEILARIAQKYGSTVTAIAAANNLANPSFIYAGQRLTIPGAGANFPPTAGPPSSGERWIDVNLSTQRLQAYEGDRVVLDTLVSTGTARYPTPTGTFGIQRKYRYDDMTGGSWARGDYYYLPNVPYAQYFYAGYALHGTYWHTSFGTPTSRGCINLSTPDAAWLFTWTSIGTKVVIDY